jgi:2',3'-cyclic-nucleotide 2'-phosphodiesterase (5'-nucleotidase family)
VDSVRTSYGQIVLVDNGGFFPLTDLHEDVALFLMDAMNLLGTDAVAVGEADLRYGMSFLKVNARAKHVPLVCANLIEKKTKKPLVDPYLIKQVGKVERSKSGSSGSSRTTAPWASRRTRLRSRSRSPRRSARSRRCGPRAPR